MIDEQYELAISPLVPESVQHNSRVSNHAQAPNYGEMMMMMMMMMMVY
jgi:hypothetical protein